MGVQRLSARQALPTGGYRPRGRDIVVGVGPAYSAEAEVAGVDSLLRVLAETAALRLLQSLARFHLGTHAQLKAIRVRVPQGVRMSSYDRQTKAGNQGDLVKHPALVAALLGLLTDQRAGFAVHFRNDLVVYAIDHRRLERGLLRKAGLPSSVAGCSTRT